MYIDSQSYNRTHQGSNPLAPFMQIDESGYGVLGQQAREYLNHKDRKHLSKNVDFIAGIRAMHNADEAMIEAKKFVKFATGRYAVGKLEDLRHFDKLDSDETAFLEHLATARAELAFALEKFKAASKADNHSLSNNVVSWTESNLQQLNQGILAIDAQALTKVEDLEHFVQPKQGRSAVAALEGEANIEAGAAYLKDKFPGFPNAHYRTAAAGVVEKLREKSTGVTP